MSDLLKVSWPDPALDRRALAGGRREPAARTQRGGGVATGDAAVRAALACGLPAPVAARLRRLPGPRGRSRRGARRQRHAGAHQEPAQGARTQGSLLRTCPAGAKIPLCGKLGVLHAAPTRWFLPSLGSQVLSLFRLHVGTRPLYAC